MVHNTGGRVVVGGVGGWDVGGGVVTGGTLVGGTDDVGGTGVVGRVCAGGTYGRGRTDDTTPSACATGTTGCVACPATVAGSTTGNTSANGTARADTTRGTTRAAGTASGAGSGAGRVTAGNTPDPAESVADDERCDGSGLANTNTAKTSTSSTGPAHRSPTPCRLRRRLGGVQTRVRVCGPTR